MILIVGAVGSGKRAFVCREFGFEPGDIAEAVLDGKPVVAGVERLVREAMCSSSGKSLDSLAVPAAVLGLADELSAKRVVICDEVGWGIVPLDAGERAWREAVGRLCCELALRADVVVRMVCGIPQVIKGEVACGGARMLMADGAEGECTSGASAADCADGAFVHQASHDAVEPTLACGRAGSGVKAATASRDAAEPAFAPELARSGSKTVAVSCDAVARSGEHGDIPTQLSAKPLTPDVSSDFPTSASGRSTLRVTLIRHGATAGNAAHRYIGARTDEPLSPDGCAELVLAAYAAQGGAGTGGTGDAASAVGATATSGAVSAVGAAGIAGTTGAGDAMSVAGAAGAAVPASNGALLPKRVYTSGMLRCEQTAAILFPQAERIAESDLREMDFGVFENRSAADMADDPAYRAWVDGGCEARCPGGEDRDGFVSRCTVAFQRLAVRAMTVDDRHLVLVVHGGTIMALLSALREDYPDYFSVRTAPGGRHELLWDGSCLRPTGGSMPAQGDAGLLQSNLSTAQGDRDSVQSAPDSMRSGSRARSDFDPSQPAASTHSDSHPEGGSLPC